MAPSIKVDYEQLQKSAKHLTTAGESVSQAAMKMISAADNAQGSWKGSAAGKFYPQWERIRANLEHVLNAMWISENCITEIARLFKEAEDKAAGAVRKRP